MRVLEGLDLHVLDDGGADLVLEVVPGQPAAQPLDEVVEEDLDVAAAGEAAEVEVPTRVGQGALVRPPEIQVINSDENLRSDRRFGNSNLPLPTELFLKV